MHHGTMQENEMSAFAAAGGQLVVIGAGDQWHIEARLDGKTHGHLYARRGNLRSFQNLGTATAKALQLGHGRIIVEDCSQYEFAL